MIDELMHYGILGMRWGVRRYQNKDGSLTSAGKKRYKKGKVTYTKEELMGFRSASQVWAHRDEYTDQELRQVIGRIQSEQQLYQLKEAENSRKVTNGKKFMDSIIVPAGKELAKTAITNTVKYGAKTGLNKVSPEVASIIFGESKKRK